MAGRVRRWLKNRRPWFSSKAQRRALGQARAQREHAMVSAGLARDAGARARAKGPDAKSQAEAFETFKGWTEEYTGGAKGWSKQAERKKPWARVLLDKISGKR